MARQAMTSTRAKTTTNTNRGSANAGSIRASTAGTNNSKGAAKSAGPPFDVNPRRREATGAPRYNATNNEQNTSAGGYAPFVYEKPSQLAITTSVAHAPARWSAARSRATATTKRPASTSRRNPNNNHGRVPYAGTPLRYTANTSGMTAAPSAVYSKTESAPAPDSFERTRPRAMARPASPASGNTAKMPMPRGNDAASRNLNTQIH